MVVRLLCVGQSFITRIITTTPKFANAFNNIILVRHASTKSTEVTEHNNEEEFHVPEETLVVHGFDQVEPIDEKPLMSLNVEKRIEKLEKHGSFSADLFIGKYDNDFLTYPDPIYDRKECKKLMDQKAMVKQIYPKIWNDSKQLQEYNFYNMFQLSVTEMMTIFEAIGESSRDCYEVNLGSLIDPSAPFHNQVLEKMGDIKLDEFNHFQVTKSILSLITRNCLTYWPIYKSSNEQLKSAFLPKKHIIFGGSKEDKDVYLPLGFAWSEQAPKLGTLPPQDWTSRGTHGAQYAEQYLVSGMKNKILADDSTEHYLVYFRDGILAQKQDEGPVGDEPNPVTDPLVGCCVLHKSELHLSPTYSDSAGFQYVDIEFDTVIPRDREVFAAQRLSAHPLNVKGLGQLATCSVELGMLKATLKRTYKYLLQKREGLLTCPIVETKLALVTSKIFAIESMVYYIAGMYDGLADGFDAHLETAILKIVTSEFGYEVLQDLQQLCGSDMLNTSRMQDQLNIYDSFLDGAIYNRIYVSMMGILWFARSKNKHLNQLFLAPWYPGYFIKEKIAETSQQADWLTLDADVIGQLHPSLSDAGQRLTWILKRVKYSADLICRRFGKDAPGAQAELSRLSQMAIDSFMLTTVCARASKAYCNGSKFSELDVALANVFSEEIVRRVRIYMAQIERSPLYTIDNRAKIMNELNLKNGGYYAHTPLDPNI